MSERPFVQQEEEHRDEPISPIESISLSTFSTDTSIDLDLGNRALNDTKKKDVTKLSHEEEQVLADNMSSISGSSYSHVEREIVQKYFDAASEQQGSKLHGEQACLSLQHHLEENNFDQSWKRMQLLRTEFTDIKAHQNDESCKHPSKELIIENDSSKSIDRLIHAYEERIKRQKEAISNINVSPLPLTPRMASSDLEKKMNSNETETNIDEKKLNDFNERLRNFYSFNSKIDEPFNTKAEHSESDVLHSTSMDEIPPFEVHKVSQEQKSLEINSKEESFEKLIVSYQ